MPLFSWCGPCRQLGPTIERLTSEPSKSGSGLPFDLVKVDTESEHGLALGQKYQVSPSSFSVNNFK